MLRTSNAKEAAKDILPGEVYECLRCHTRYPGAELLKQREPTCSNCGYRIFRKVRGPVSKSLKAE